MVNKYKPHLLVIPEDDANRQMLNGFLKHPGLAGRAIQALPCAGGWRKVIRQFEEQEIQAMENNLHQSLLLLIDFDNDGSRLKEIQAKIPPQLIGRVFVLGVFSEPEKLKGQLNMSYEKLGEYLTKECPESPEEKWNVPLLAHNQKELTRLLVHAKGFLFNQ